METSQNKLKDAMKAAMAPLRPTLSDELKAMSEDLLRRAVEILTDLAAIRRVREMGYVDEFKVTISVSDPVAQELKHLASECTVALPALPEVTGGGPLPSSDIPFPASQEVIGVTVLGQRKSEPATDDDIDLEDEELDEEPSAIRFLPPAREYKDGMMPPGPEVERILPPKESTHIVLAFARGHRNLFSFKQFRVEMASVLPAKFLSSGVYSVVKRMVKSKHLRKTQTRGVFQLYAKYARKK